MEKKNEKYKTKQSIGTGLAKPNLKTHAYEKLIEQLTDSIYYDIEWENSYVAHSQNINIQNSSTKKTFLDVFDRIRIYDENKNKKLEFEKLGVVEQKGRFFVPSPKFDDSKIDVANFEYQPPKYKKYNQQGGKIPENTQAFYDYVLKQKRANKNLLDDAKFKNYLQSGINFIYMTEAMEGELYQHLSSDELRVLFDYGMSIELAIYMSSEQPKVQDKLVYNTVREIESPVFYVINHNNLEKLINTRKVVSIYKDFWSEYIKSADERHNFEYIKNIEVMLKYGQIELNAEQIKTIGDRFSSRLDSTPLIKAIYEYCKNKTQTQTMKKEQQQTTEQVVEPTQDVKSQIDKLFEDAQRNL